MFSYGKPERRESSTERYDAVQNLHGRSNFNVVFAVQSSSVLRRLCTDSARMSYL